MVKERHKWTSKEEEALLAGVKKHGQGKWQMIINDSRFASSLRNRSNIDLKDKWRNISVNRERVRTPMLEGVTTSADPPLNSPQPLSVVPLIEYGGTPAPSRSTIAPDYEVMILEALSYIGDPNGTDINTILSYLEQRFDDQLPGHFRRSVTSKLRRLVLSGVLEKVGNNYKVKGAFSGAETSQREDVGLSNDDNRDEEMEAPDSPDSPVATETPEDAAMYAANAVAHAECKKQEVIEAFEEADRYGKLAEESMAMLKLAEHVHELCKKDGFALVKA